MTLQKRVGRETPTEAQRKRAIRTDGEGPLKTMRREKKVGPTRDDDMKPTALFVRLWYAILWPGQCIFFVIFFSKRLGGMEDHYVKVGMVACFILMVALAVNQFRSPSEKVGKAEIVMSYCHQSRLKLEPEVKLYLHFSVKTFLPIFCCPISFYLFSPSTSLGRAIGLCGWKREI